MVGKKGDCCSLPISNRYCHVFNQKHSCCLKNITIVVVFTVVMKMKDLVTLSHTTFRVIILAQTMIFPYP